jgi:hypothetical protein
MKDELVVIKEIDIPALFQKDGSNPIIEGLKKEAAKFKGDVDTKEGRDEIRTFARKFASSKTYLDGLGKALSDDLRAQIAPINDERNKIKTCCDELRDKVRQPLTDFENKEKQRVADIEERIHTIEDFINVQLALITTSESAKDALDRINKIEVDETFEEFELAATKAKAAAVTQLEAKFIVLQNAEKEKAEAERLEKERLEKEREEREKKIAEEAATKARKEAEEKARQERLEKEIKEKEEKERLEKEKLEAQLAKEKAEKEQKESEERAEQEKKEAAAKAEREKIEAIESEKKRQAEEQKAKVEAEEKRQANAKHRNKILQEIEDDFKACGDFNVKEAMAFVEAVLDGDIRHIKIEF